jgi:hypothetical protein
VKSLISDDHEYHVVPKEELADLTFRLAGRTSKDAVPHGVIAKSIGGLAERVANAGKELHILLPCCNTIRAVEALQLAIPAPAHKHVWVLCTNSVWPSDLAPFLWHHYGSLVQQADMQPFRSATRTLLGEYTDHYKRQRIEDQSLREARGGALGGLELSLAEAAFLDRLDAVKAAAYGDVEMEKL